MYFAFTEEQEELRRNARRLLETASTTRDVRAAMATVRGYDEKLWRRLGEELGLTSLAIPEAYGGAGLGFVELAAVMEEMGRALLCGPFFATVCLAASAVLTGGTEEQKRELLPGIAAGRTTATVAFAPPSGRWDAPGSGMTYAARDGGYELSGTSAFVIDGHSADLVLVAARPASSPSDGGPAIFVVPGATPGLERRARTTMDLTRKQAELTLRQVRLPASALLGAAESGERTLARALDLAKVALAAEQVGGAQRCLDMSLDYAKTRLQFGRPIGSFQAIKHKLADMFVELESARSASYYAAWVAAHSHEELPSAAALAKAYCSDAYFHLAAECIQIHGGVGFTWEHDAHLFFKRAKSSETLFGDAAFHRAVVARQMGL
ncbi:MAG TPA: acyl-CoA dehydrogenase family protein [Polyangiaceae bacterium]|jgi:alkylation response protein AidB-like acyl-CoA dehydrogenase|nr:acyl-CoA dehydrogenase family protein [Polyangiaceae bacterium]